MMLIAFDLSFCLIISEMQADDSFSTTAVRSHWEDSFCHVVLRDVTSNESLNNVTECMVKDQQKGNLDYLGHHFLIRNYLNS